MSNIYLFKMHILNDEKIEYVVSANSVKGAIMLIKRDLKKELIPLKKQANDALKKEIKLILDMGINYRKKSKEEKDKTLLYVLDEWALFGFKDKLKVTYNYYMANKKQFRIDFINEYMNYYNRKDYSFEFNLKNDDFEVINLSKLTRGTKKNKLFITHIELNKQK